MLAELFWMKIVQLCEALTNLVVFCEGNEKDK